MMNVVAAYGEGAWRVIAFPRARHRAESFFREGDQRILVSPGAVDLCGLCVTPQERDFEMLTADGIAAILDEVSLAPEKLEDIASELGRRLRQDLGQ